METHILVLIYTDTHTQTMKRRLSLRLDLATWLLVGSLLTCLLASWWPAYGMARWWPADGQVTASWWAVEDNGLITSDGQLKVTLKFFLSHGKMIFEDIKYVKIILIIIIFHLFNSSEKSSSEVYIKIVIEQDQSYLCSRVKPFCIYSLGCCMLYSM